jgi:hypothetical protein
MLLLARQSWVKTLAHLAQPVMLLMMTSPTSALPSLGAARPAMEIKAVLLSTCSADKQCLLLQLVNSQAISLVHWQHLLPPLLPHLTCSGVLPLPLLRHLRLLELLFQASHLLKSKVRPPWTC